MKSAITWAKPILLTLCLILTVGNFVSAQENPPTDKNDKSSSPSTEKKSSEQPPVSEEDRKRFYKLTQSATEALTAGETENAKAFAETLLKQAETMPEDWNYGNAIHVANLVLGHIALASGDLKEAKRCLLAAGNTPGSPQLNSFGPNMRLAKALLEKNENDAVLEYFELCAKFWKPQFSKLDGWKAAVQKNEMPDFQANLRYYFP